MTRTSTRKKGKKERKRRKAEGRAESDSEEDGTRAQEPNPTREDAGGSTGGGVGHHPDTGPTRPSRHRGTAAMALLDTIEGMRTTSHAPVTGTPLGGASSSVQTEADRHETLLRDFAYTASGTPTALHVNMTDPTLHVFPLEMRLPHNPKDPRYRAVPNSRCGHPVILLGYPGDFGAHCTGRPHSGHQALHTSRVAAMLHIMQHYLNTEAPPETLCLNCYTHHEGVAPCPDKPRDLQGLIDAARALPATDPRHAIYSPCVKCGKPHPPTRQLCAARL